MHSSLSMIVAVTEKSSFFLTEKSYPSVRRPFLQHQGVVRSRGEGTGYRECRSVLLSTRD